MSKENAQQWLAEAAGSTGRKDLGAHTGMISKRVSLKGVPGFDNIDHETWFGQCKHEFENDVIKSVAYEGLKLITITDSQVKLKTFETMTGTDGTANVQGVEMLLEKEQDGVWRRVKERVLPLHGAMSDNLVS